MQLFVLEHYNDRDFVEQKFFTSAENAIMYFKQYLQKIELDFEGSFKFKVEYSHNRILAKARHRFQTITVFETQTED